MPMVMASSGVTCSSGVVSGVASGVGSAAGAGVASASGVLGYCVALLQAASESISTAASRIEIMRFIVLFLRLIIKIKKPVLRKGRAYSRVTTFVHRLLAQSGLFEYCILASL